MVTCSTAPVNFSTIADVVEIKAAEFRVELVKHTVISDTQFEFQSALQSLVRERFQSHAQLIYFPLHISANGMRQAVESAGESGRPDLERSGHSSLGLVRRVIASGDFPVRLVELGLHVVGQFEAIFDVFLVPRMELFQFRP